MFAVMVRKMKKKVITVPVDGLIAGRFYKVCWRSSAVSIWPDPIFTGRYNGHFLYCKQLYLEFSDSKPIDARQIITITPVGQWDDEYGNSNDPR